MHRPTLIALLLAPLCVIAAAGASAQQTNDVTVCFSRGSENYKDKDFIALGLRACTRLIAVRTGRGLAAAYGARGYWHVRQNNLEAAMADLDQAIKTDPKNVELYDYRADIWMEKGNFEQALASYEMSIRVDPTYAPAYYGRGRAYESLGQIERAKESYNATLAAPEKDRIGAWAHDQARRRLEALAK